MARWTLIFRLIPTFFIVALHTNDTTLTFLLLPQTPASLTQLARKCFTSAKVSTNIPDLQFGLGPSSRDSQWIIWREDR